MAEISPSLAKYLLLMSWLGNCSGGPVDGHDENEDSINPPLPDTLEPVDQHVKDTYADAISQDEGTGGADTFPDTFDAEFTSFDTYLDTIDGMCEISETCAPLDTYDTIDTSFDTDASDAGADDGILVIPELPKPFDTPSQPDLPPPDILPPPPDVQPPPDIQPPPIDTPQPLQDTVTPPPDTNQSQPDTIQSPPDEDASADTSEDSADVAGADGPIQCSPISAEDFTCNSIDDDCDGLIDEHYIQTATTCGVGECLATGIKTCIGGLEDNSCEPKTPTLNDASCNGEDNDCDGSTDEDHVPSPTTCGDGACFAQGAWVCYNGGILENTCTPGAPTAEACDGADNDCDKEVDEGCECKSATYEPVTTTCGKGECASTGATSCDSGKVKDSCKPKVPAPNDASCDGKDNNCNGSADEGYVAQQTQCGVGACIAQGLKQCIGGQEIDNCASKQAAPSDATCNNVDDDCDGVADDDYEPYQITCGTGPCANTINTSCTNGIEDNLCTPGTPTNEICDEIDNNCNGSIDEALPDNDGDGICNDIDCEINEPNTKYLVISCPGLSIESCWDALTVKGDTASISINYFSKDIPFQEGSGIQLCYDKLSYSGTPDPAPIACLETIFFEVAFFGKKFIWNSEDSNTSLFFDKPASSAGLSVYYPDGKEILFNMLSCEWI